MKELSESRKKQIDQSAVNNELSIVITGKRIRIKAVKYYVIVGQLIKLKVVNYSRLRPKYTKKVNSPKEIIKKEKLPKDSPQNFHHKSHKKRQKGA